MKQAFLKLSTFFKSNQPIASLLFIFVCFLPILVLRDFSPSNELRYLSIADEALRNNHWFILSNQGEMYSDKPPFYFWIIMVSKMLFGHHYMFTNILFSIIPALLIVVIIDRWCKKELILQSRIMAPFLLMSTGFYVGSAIVMRMDMLMVLFIVGALYTFYKLYKNIGNRRLNQFLFPVFILLGIYSKAFMGFLIPFITILCFLWIKKEGKTFGRYWGWRTWLVLLLGFGIWFGMVYIEGGPNYLYNLTIGQAVSRSVKVSTHKHPFWYYLFFLSYSVAPWTLFYVGSLIRSWRKKIFKSDIQLLFSIEIISTFIMLSCFGSKLEIYLLPIFPFMTYLSLIALQHIKNWNPWLAFSLAFPAILLVGAFPAYLIISYLNLIPVNSFWMFLATAILSIGCFYSLRATYKNRNLLKGAQAFCLTFYLVIFTGGLALPKLNSLIGYSQMAERAIEISQQFNTKGVCTYRVHRPENLDVYLGYDIKKIKKEEILHLDNQGYLLIVPEKCFKDSSFVSIIKNKKERIKEGKYYLIPL